MSTPKPFECKYPPQFPELLYNLKISLAVSTYQAGKVILLSSFDKDRLIQLPRTFPNAMGMATMDDLIAVSTQSTVELLKNNSGLAKIYPKKPNVYDSMYMPRSTYHTGYLALHDMAFIKEKLVAVNTLFSSLSYIDEKQSFIPFWQPPFISELEPEDRCHLNGIAVENEEIKYVTALGSTNSKQGWRENKTTGGILMEYPSGKIILEGLAMPHSPRIYDGKLYVLNSAQGELIEVNTETGTYEVVVNIGGFARGMTRVGEYLFIGVSKLRHNSQVFKDLPIAKTSFAGVVAVHLPYKTIVGKIEYQMSVDEIYDVKILLDKIRPNIISPDMDTLKGAITFDDKVYWGEIKDENQINEQQQNNPFSLKNKIQIQVLKGIKPSDLLSQFNNLICKEFKTSLENKLIINAQNIVVASNNNMPIGIVVFEAKQDKTANIRSVFVRKEYRQKRIATALLKQTQTIFQQNSIQYVEAVFKVKNIDKDIAKRLFIKFDDFNLIIED